MAILGLETPEGPLSLGTTYAKGEVKNIYRMCCYIKVEFFTIGMLHPLYQK